MGCTFDDETGQSRPMIMGCYGFGVGRTLAAAVEQNHDEDGIIWPRPLAPFEAVVLALNVGDAAVRTAAERLYEELVAGGADVFYDDRGERPGVKFKDADLVGFPVRLVVGAQSLERGEVEISLRRDRVKRPTPVAEASARVIELLASL
jgi:prolyl-tRNA synthetase